MAHSEIMHGPAQAAANLLGDVQAKILLLMHAKKVSRAALARSLGMSAPRVTQMLGADSNITLETLARIFVALGERPEITSDGIRAALSGIESADTDEAFATDHQIDEASSEREVDVEHERLAWLGLIGRSIEADTVSSMAALPSFYDEEAQEYELAA